MCVKEYRKKLCKVETIKIEYECAEDEYCGSN